MSKMKLEVMLTAMDRLSGPLRGIQRQSRITAQRFKSDMGQYNATLKKTENALKVLERQNRAMREAGMNVSGKRLVLERTYRKRIEETNSAIRDRNLLMDKEMGSLRKRQAYMDKGQTQVWEGTKRMAKVAALGYAFSRAIQPGISFEKEMSNVQALTGLEKNSEILDALAEEAKRLGRTTQRSTTDIAKAMTFYAQAGFKPKEILAAIEDTVHLSVATNVSVEEAADVGSGILAGFELDPSEMGRVGDVISTASTSSKADLNILRNAMSYAAPVANQLNVSLEQMATLIGILADLGMGSKAGPALRKILSSLAAPTAAASKALEELGVETKDLEGNLRDPATMFLELAKAIERLGTAEALDNLTLIVGLEASSALSGFMSDNSLDDLSQNIELKFEEGTTRKMAKAMGDNLAGDIESLSSAFEGLRISIFGASNGALRPFLQRLAKITEKVAGFLEKHPKLTKAIMVIAGTFTALTAVLGAAAVAMGIFNMTILANPIIVAITGIIAALSVLGYVIYTHWEKISKVVMPFLRLIGLGAAIIGGLTAGVFAFVKAGSILKVAIAGGAIAWKAFTAAVIANPVGATIAGITVAGVLLYKNWDNLKLLFEDGILGAMNKIGDWFGRIPVFGGILKAVFYSATAPLRLMLTIFDAIKKILEWVLSKASEFKEMFSFEMPGWMKDGKNWIGGKLDTASSWFWGKEGNTMAEEKHITDNSNTNITVHTQTNATPQMIAGAVSKAVNGNRNMALLGDLD